MEEKTWDYTIAEFIETPQEIKNFFNEIDAVCTKYNLSISYEDGHGNFIIENYNKNNIDWLKGASKNY